MTENWLRNPGHLPEDAKTVPGGLQRRVRVRFADGSEPLYAGTLNPMIAMGWPSDGRHGCRWTRTGSPFDIEEYLVL